MPYIRRDQVAGMNHHYHYYTLDYFLREQAQMGLKTIEFWAGSPHIWMDHYTAYDTDKVKRQIASYGFDVACVTPENTMYPCQAAAWVEELRERSFAYFSNGICLTAELGCDKMSMNCGWGWVGEEKKESFKRSAEMLARLADTAKKNGIILMVESSCKDVSNVVCTLSDMKALIDTVGHPSLKPMINTTAVSCAGEKLEEWFDAFGADIRHIHFVDGKPEGQLIWGDGIQSLAQWLEVLEHYGYEGCLGQDVTDGHYFEHPEFFDKRNIKNLERYMKG